MDDLFVDGWTPNINGTSNGGWGRRDDHKDATGPEICWDHNGSVQPLALIDMTEEEKGVRPRTWRWRGILLTEVAGFRIFRQLTIETSNSEHE